MPSRPDTIDERFDAITAQLRAARPEPSDALRERVLTLGDQPAAAPRRRFRLALPALRPPAVAAAAAVTIAAIAVGVAVVERPGNDGALEGSGATQSEPAFAERAQEPAQSSVEKATDQAAPAGAADARQSLTSPPPSGTRLQDYRAELRVRVGSVDDLSGATAQAMRTARSLGGYVVNADFDAPSGDNGDSTLVFRVPVSRVQEAIVRLSGLGDLVSQRISLQDLQEPLERQTDAIGDLRGRIQSLQRRLRSTTLGEEERARLQLELLQAKQQLADQLRQRADTLQRARLALVSLALTTRDGAAVIPAPPGESEQRLRDALEALRDMVTWFLYAAIVAAPFLLLAVIGVALDRRRRRRADDRLLQNV